MKILIFAFLQLLIIQSFAQDIVLNEMLSSNQTINTDQDGDYEDWLELYNSGGEAVNLGGYILIEDSSETNRWVFPKKEIQAGEHLLIWTSGKDLNNPEGDLHTNFSIKSSGELVQLIDPSGNLVDQIPPTDMETDLSYGRYPDGTGEWTIFTVPTPATENLDNIFQGKCELPLFDHAPGHYTSSITISLSTSTPSGSIYYTLDGSVPTEESSAYTNPIPITQTTVVRSRVFADELLPSEVGTNTYLINEEYTMPIASVTTDPHNLYDPDYGIFVYSDPYQESNLFQDWERPVHIQFFEDDKSLAFSMDAGLKVHGGLTRAVPGKSLAIMARSVYGSNSIEHKIFPNKELASFKNLVLRNGGNDFNYTIFRDCFMQDIIRDQMDLDLSDRRPAIVFLNGEYWGIRNIREKLNEHFIARNQGIDPDDVTLLEYVHHNNEVLEPNGSNEDFNDLISFIQQNDLSEESAYEEVASRIDINNYIQYYVAQIYFDNSDWPGNNIKWWRDSNAGGKYRWLLFDTDFGFGLSPFGNEQGDELLHYKHNTLALSTAPNGDEWPNPPHSTFLMRKLLDNVGFRNQFINTFCDHLNSTFQPERVLPILFHYQNLFEPEIEQHRQKFPSSKNWDNELEVMETFAEKRPDFLYGHLLSQFSLSRQKILSLNVDDEEKGIIKVNSIQCDNFPWQGIYFPNIPVSLRATPKPGYSFVKWSDGNTSQVRVIDIGETSELKAVFESTSVESVPVRISEINYMSSDALDTEDWVEIYNPSGSWADIGLWVFKDSDDEHAFVFPAGTLIEPKKALVLCRDTGKFKTIHPDISQIIGDIDFGFSSDGEVLRLFDQNNELVDYVDFGVSAPWPELSEQSGYTIEVIDIDYDNEPGANWKKSHEKGGTPGKVSTGTSGVLNTSKKEEVLVSNYPNPFAVNTTIAYHVDTPCLVQINLYNVAGSKVRTLFDSKQTAGNHTVTWDGNDSTGQPLTGNIFFYEIIMPHHREVRKMLKQ